MIAAAKRVGRRRFRRPAHGNRNGGSEMPYELTLTDEQLREIISRLDRIEQLARELVPAGNGDEEDES